MNKQFFLSTLVLLFGFSALAVNPNIQRNKSKRAPIGVQKTEQADEAILDEQEAKPTISESWSKFIRLKWTSMSKDDVWNVGASIVTCGVIAYIYRHMPRNPAADNAANAPDNGQGPGNVFVNGRGVFINGQRVGMPGQQPVLKGSGIQANKNIACLGIHKIKVGGIGTLVITQDARSPEALVIGADNNILPNIKTLVANNTLEINIEGSIQPVTPITYHVTVKNLSHIEVSGAVSVQVPGEITANVLKVVASGSTNMTGTINVEKLDTDVSGVSKLILSGNAPTQNLSASGSSSFNGNNLKGKKATVNESGTSKTSVNISGVVDGELSGVSMLEYLGNPMIRARTSGLASITRG